MRHLLIACLAVFALAVVVSSAPTGASKLAKTTKPEVTTSSDESTLPAPPKEGPKCPELTAILDAKCPVDPENRCKTCIFNRCHQQNQPPLSCEEAKACISSKAEGCDATYNGSR